MVTDSSTPEAVPQPGAMHSPRISVSVQQATPNTSHIPGPSCHGSPQQTQSAIESQPSHHTSCHAPSRLDGLSEGIKKRTAAIYHMAKPWHYVGRDTTGPSALDAENPSSPTLDHDGEDPANNLLLALQQKLFENYHVVAYTLIIAAYFLAFCEYLYLRLYSLIFPERVVYRQGCAKHANETIVRNEFHYASATVVFTVIGTFQLVCFFLLTVSGRWLEVKRTFTNFISMEERLHNELAFAIKRVMFLTVVPSFLVYFLCSTVVACDIFYMVGMRDPVPHLGSQIIIYFYDVLVLVYFVTFPLISLLYHPSIGCGIGAGTTPMGARSKGRKSSKNLQNQTSSTTATGSFTTTASASAAGPAASVGQGQAGADADVNVGRTTSSPLPARRGHFAAAQYSSLPLPAQSPTALPQQWSDSTSVVGDDGGVEPSAPAGQSLSPAAPSSNDYAEAAVAVSNNQAAHHQQPVLGDGKRPRGGRRHKDDKALSSTTAAGVTTSPPNRPNLRFPSILQQQRDSIRAKADRYRRLSETDTQQPTAVAGDTDAEPSNFPPAPSPFSVIHSQRSDDVIEQHNVIHTDSPR